MADERNYYVLCDDNCKFPAMTKEQTLTAITQAVETGSIHDVDTGFVTKIVEQNKQIGLSFWVGTSAEYNAIENKAANCFYIITDDVIKADLLNEINTLKNSLAAAEAKLAQQNAVLWEGNLLCDFEISSGNISAENIEKYNLFAVEVARSDNETECVTIPCYKTSNGNLNGATTYLSREYEIFISIFTGGFEVQLLNVTSNNTTAAGVLKKVIGIM